MRKQVKKMILQDLSPRFARDLVIKNIRVSLPKFLTSIAICLALLVFGLVAEASADADNSNWKESKTYCKKENFQEFLAEFSEKSEFQDKYTAYPIKFLTIVIVDPEPKQKISFVSRNQAEKINLRFPNAEKREELGLNKMSIKKLTNKVMKVTLSKEDTGFVIDYLFKLDTCWQLIEIQDWSI